MDLEKYLIKLNLKTIAYWETFTGKNFFRLSESNADDYLKLIYSSVVTNNPTLVMDYGTFKILAGDKKVAKWIENEFRRIMSFNEQTKMFGSGEDESDNNVGGNQKEDEMKMTDVATALIMRYKLDPHYVWYDMDLWEIQHYFKLAEEMKKEGLIEKRFWTYLTVAPHINTKKCKTPQKYLPFDWEQEERNKNKMKELEENKYAINNLIGKKLDWIK